MAAEHALGHCLEQMAGGDAPGTHTVQIRMASSTPGDQVAIETAFFYIDWNTIGVEVATGCNPGNP